MTTCFDNCETWKLWYICFLFKIYIISVFLMFQYMYMYFIEKKLIGLLYGFKKKSSCVSPKSYSLTSVWEQIFLGELFL